MGFHPTLTEYSLPENISEGKEQTRIIQPEHDFLDIIQLVGIRPVTYSVHSLFLEIHSLPEFYFQVVSK